MPVPLKTAHVRSVTLTVCSVGSTSQPLTSWAQRQKLRPKKSRAGPAPSQYQERLHSPEESLRPSPLESTDSQDQVQPDSRSSPSCCVCAAAESDPVASVGFQHRAAGPRSSSFPLRRSDSLMSEASGDVHRQSDMLVGADHLQ